MKNHEAPQTPHLTEVPYPGELRTDGLSDTFADQFGNTYLVPDVLENHDFEATRLLVEHHLTGARVTDTPYGAGVMYSRDTNLISLTALLNAANGGEETQADVTSALTLVGRFLDAAYKAGFSPEKLPFPSVAVDRANSRVELLPPYRNSEEPVGPAVSLAKLIKSISDSTQTEFERNLLDASYLDALKELGEL